MAAVTVFDGKGTSHVVVTRLEGGDVLLSILVTGIGKPHGECVILSSEEAATLGIAPPDSRFLGEMHRRIKTMRGSGT